MPRWCFLVPAITLLIVGCSAGSTPGPATPSPTALAATPSATALAATPSPSPSVPPTPAPVRVTPEATIAVPGIGGLAFDGTELWVLSGAGEVGRLDPATNTLGPLTMIDATHAGGGFEANAQGLWLNNFDANVLLRIDPTSLEVVARIPVGPNPEGLAIDPQNQSIWVANHRGGTIARIDPTTNQVVDSVDAGNVGSSGPQSIGVGLGSIWVGVPNTLSIYRIDALTNEIQATIRVPNGAVPCGGFAFTNEAVWAGSCEAATALARIDPVTNEAAALIKLDGYGSDPVIVDGKPWVVLESVTGAPGLLIRIDPSTNAIDRVLSLEHAFVGGNLVVAAGSVWVLDWSGNQVLRLPLSRLRIRRGRVVSL